MVPRIPADLHAARGRDHPLPQARPRVHRAGRARGRASRRRSRPPARRVRRRAGSGRSGRRHRRRADLARRRGRRLGDLGRVRPPRQAVDRAGLRADRRWPTPDGAGRRRLRDRDHRPASAGPAPAASRCSTPRAPGCASDRRGSPDVEGAAGRIVVDGRPVAFEPGDSVAVAILRAGEVPGRGGTLCLAGDCGNCLAQVDGVAYVRTCQAAARPGMAVVRHPAGGDAATPRGRRPGPRPRRRSSDEVPVWRVETDVAVIGGGTGGRGRGEQRGGAGRLVDACSTRRPATRSSAIYAGPDDRGPDAGGRCSTSIRTRSSSRPGPPRSSRSARATSWPGSSRPGPPSGSTRRRATRDGRGDRHAADGVPARGVDGHARPVRRRRGRPRPRRRDRGRGDRRRDDDAGRHGRPRPRPAAARPPRADGRRRAG